MLERLEKDESLAAFAGRFVPLKLVTDRNEEWADWNQKYKHEGGTIPILFVIRSDGEQLYGKSGSLRGNALPEMLASVLQQAGRGLNEEEFLLLETCNAAAEDALKEDKLLTAARAMHRVSKIAPLGNLESFAEPAIKANELSASIGTRLLESITENERKLDDPATQLAALVAIHEIDAFSESLPGLKARMQELNRSLRKNQDIRDLTKPAQSIARARSLMASGKSRDRRTAEKSLQTMLTRHPDSEIAELATSELTQFGFEVPTADKANEEPDQKELMESFRRWSDESGSFSIHARLVSAKDGMVVLEKTDGTTVEVSITRLSASDQQHISDR